MKTKTKAAIALISLVIGMFLLLEGSKVTVSDRPMELDLTFVVVGAVLVLVYPTLIGNYLEVKLGASRTVSFMPMLLVLGAVLIYQGAVRPINIIEKLLFVALGIVLVVAPAIVLYKTASKKKRSK